MANKYERTVQVTFPAEDTFWACITALQNLGYKKLEMDRNNFYVETKQGLMTWNTSPAILICAVKKVDNASASVQITSRARISTHVFDNGGHESNVNLIEAELRKILRQAR